jgi:predicted nucleic acid-binding protein
MERQDTSLFTAQISLVEVYSALNRRLRENFINADEYRSIVAQLMYLFESIYNVMTFSAQIAELACSILERQPLRALDAIHLATALVVNEQLVRQQRPTLTFLATDHRLLGAAATEGLATLDPTNMQ